MHLSDLPELELVYTVTARSHSKNGSQCREFVMLSCCLVGYLSSKPQTSQAHRYYNMTFNVGCLPQIRGQTIISLAKLIATGRLHGSLKAQLSMTGKRSRQVQCCGSMVYVCPEPPFLLPLLIVSDIIAGSGKTVFWYGIPQLFLASVSSCC